MRGLEFTINIVAKSIANGLLIISAGTNIIRFVPPLVITKKMWMKCMRNWTKSFQKFSGI